MPPAAPMSLSWTLRLKYRKCTVILHVDPLESLRALKTDLIEALQNLKTPLADIPEVPKTPSRIQLAKPKDMLDANVGWEGISAWERIDAPEDDLFGDEVDELAADEERTRRASAKGKGSARKAKQKNRGDDRTIKELGITDNAVLAFKILPEDDGAEQDEDDEQWDVVIPTYEDTYDVENEGDLGQLKEYRG